MADITEKEIVGLNGSWYSNQPAQTYDFNTTIGFEKYASSPEISARICQNLLVWFGSPILDTFLVISPDSVNLFSCDNSSRSPPVHMSVCPSVT